MQVPRFIRQFTDPLVGSIPVPIVGGPNRGMLWSLANAGGGFVTGRRSAEQMNVISALLHEGDVFWDIGAHHGSVTLFGSRRVGPKGHVHAFEPSGMNRWFLERHVRWNGLKNVTIQPYALSNFDGEAKFGGSGASTGFALNEGGETVQVRTMRALISQGIQLPTFVKVDVQNAEADLLRGGLEALRPDTRLLISIHSRESNTACSELLRKAGFSLVESRDMATMAHGDADLAAFGPGYSSTAKDRERLQAVGF